MAGQSELSCCERQGYCSCWCGSTFCSDLGFGNEELLVCLVRRAYTRGGWQLDVQRRHTHWLGSWLQGRVYVESEVEGTREELVGKGREPSYLTIRVWIQRQRGMDVRRVYLKREILLFTPNYDRLFHSNCHCITFPNHSCLCQQCSSTCLSRKCPICSLRSISHARN